MSAEELLRRLLGGFYSDRGRLKWGWQEDVGVDEVDPGLNDALQAYIAAHNIPLNI